MAYSNTSSSVDFTVFENKIKRVQKAMEIGRAEGMRKTMLGAQNKAKNKVEVMGTIGSAKRFRGEYTKANFGPGNSPGRNDTGAMKNSIITEIQITASKVSGRVGWLRNYKKYFGIQNAGFRNRRGYNGHRFFIKPRGTYTQVRGMHLWKDTELTTRKLGPANMAREIKKELAKIK